MAEIKVSQQAGVTVATNNTNTVPVSNLPTNTVGVMVQRSWDIHNYLTISKTRQWSILGNVVTKTVTRYWDIHAYLAVTTIRYWDIHNYLTVLTTRSWDIYAAMQIMVVRTWQIIGQALGAVINAFTVGRR